MGNQTASLSIYSKLLENPSTTISQEQVSLSIVEVYGHFGEVDPTTLIAFLLSLLNNGSSSPPQACKE
jgi:hypothetical protein